MRYMIKYVSKDYTIQPFMDGEAPLLFTSLGAAQTVAKALETLSQLHYWVEEV